MQDGRFFVEYYRSGNNSGQFCEIDMKKLVSASSDSFLISKIVAVVFSSLQAPIYTVAPRSANLSMVIFPSPAFR
jgi:hypothetical protein